MVFAVSAAARANAPEYERAQCRAVARALQRSLEFAQGHMGSVVHEAAVQVGISTGRGRLFPPPALKWTASPWPACNCSWSSAGAPLRGHLGRPAPAVSREMTMTVSSPSRLSLEQGVELWQRHPLEAIAQAADAEGRAATLSAELRRFIKGSGHQLRRHLRHGLRVLRLLGHPAPGGVSPDPTGCRTTSKGS